MVAFNNYVVAILIFVILAVFWGFFYPYVHHCFQTAQKQKEADLTALRAYCRPSAPPPEPVSHENERFDPSAVNRRRASDTPDPAPCGSTEKPPANPHAGETFAASAQAHSHGSAPADPPDMQIPLEEGEVLSSDDATTIFRG